MNESVIIGLVVGGGVALITGYISHWFRLREMKIQSAEERERLEALWAEEKRRRKSDRRRELYERELSAVADAADAVVEAISKVSGLASAGKDKTLERHIGLLAEVGLMLERGSMKVFSLKDEELKNEYKKLLDGFGDWCKLLDINTGQAQEGKEEKFEELETETEWAAAELSRRIREILEEV